MIVLLLLTTHTILYQREQLSGKGVSDGTGCKADSVVVSRS